MGNYYKIAGLTVLLDTWGKTLLQAEPYRIEKTNDIDINISVSTLLDEGHVLSEIWPDCNEDSLEYLGTGALFYRYLLDFNGMMLHSSCVVVDNQAYLFTANPGTGKSTHTNLWLKLFGDRAYILNDDKPALRLEDGVWYAYGTPWSGKNDISVNTRVPVAGIACIDRGLNNKIEPFSGLEAIQSILRQVNRPRNIRYRGKLLELLDKLIVQIPIWKLQCNMNIDAAIVSYEAMSGKKV